MTPCDAVPGCDEATRSAQACSGRRLMRSCRGLQILARPAGILKSVRVAAVGLVLAACGCTAPASPGPVLDPGSALVGRYAMGVDALGLVFTIDELKPDGENRFTVVGRARGSLADMGGDVECTFEESGRVDVQNVDLTFTPGPDCPPAFGDAPVSVRLRMKLSGYALSPEAFRGDEVEAVQY